MRAWEVGSYQSSPSEFPLSPPGEELGAEEEISTGIHLARDQNGNWRYVIGDEVVIGGGFFTDGYQNVGEVKDFPIRLFWKNYVSQRTQKFENPVIRNLK